MKLGSMALTDPCQVECPVCKAKPGWSCRTRGFGGDRAAHEKRRELASMNIKVLRSQAPTPMKATSKKLWSIAEEMESWMYDDMTAKQTRLLRKAVEDCKNAAAGLDVVIDDEEQMKWET